MYAPQKMLEIPVSASEMEPGQQVVTRWPGWTSDPVTRWPGWTSDPATRLDCWPGDTAASDPKWPGDPVQNLVQAESHKRSSLTLFLYIYIYYGLDHHSSIYLCGVYVTALMWVSCVGKAHYEHQIYPRSTFNTVPIFGGCQANNVAKHRWVSKGVRGYLLSPPPPSGKSDGGLLFWEIGDAKFFCR